MISVGLDLSLARTGVAIIEDGKLLYSGVIKSKPSGHDPEDELIRIRDIVSRIKSSIDHHTTQVDVVVIEGLAFMARNTSALVQLAGLNYLARALCQDSNWKFVIVAPSSLKKFVTGKGVGDKSLMLLEVYKRWGHSFLDDNEADAFALAQVAQDLDSKTLTKPQQEVINLLKPQL